MGLQGADGRQNLCAQVLLVRAWHVLQADSLISDGRECVYDNNAAQNKAHCDTYKDYILWVQCTVEYIMFCSHAFG